ncbi:neo-calmodulin-like [Pecten maximus]|uniref:neo-calmodulin-like n=1 Tax=Pecten maximus TaxID=6579 RepID=UPI001458C213|nr:neo-calmodulin-like [Pecten maximus]XP_033727263.1 neo-calmodulin-like [Pecten maximus]
MAQSSITDKEGELTNAARTEIKRIFRLIDTTGNGKIGVNDLMRSMQLSGGNPTKEEAQRMIEESDMDGSGSVEYQEFENIMKIHILALEYQNDILRDAFRRFDKNGDGSLDREELRKVLCSIGESLTDEEAEEMFALVDADNNGKVDLDEFLAAFKAS